MRAACSQRSSWGEKSWKLVGGREVEVEVPARPTADKKAVNKYQCSGAVRQRQHRSRSGQASAGERRSRLG
jgi:hypothetical protein